MSETAFLSTRPTFMLAGERRPDLGQALGSMVLSLPRAGSAHGELHFANWGVTPDGGVRFTFDDIALGDRIAITVDDDRAGRPSTLIDAEITAIEERYGEGAPVKVLLIQDGLHRLARSRNSRVFEERSPDDVVRAIASDAGLGADVDVSLMTGTWHQLNESDLAFLTRLLTGFDVPLRLQDGRLHARRVEVGGAPIELSMSIDVLRARLIADLNHQPVASRVSGFDLGLDQEADYSHADLDPPAAGESAATVLGRLAWQGAERVPQPFARNQAEAVAWSTGHFSRQARRFVHGEMHCIGMASLRPGQQVAVRGASARFNGRYRIDQAVHRFDNLTGFETRLRVSRPDLEAA